MLFVCYLCGTKIFPSYERFRIHKQDYHNDAKAPWRDFTDSKWTTELKK